MSLDTAFVNVFSPASKRSADVGGSFLNDLIGWFPFSDNTKPVHYKNSLKLSAVFNAVEQISNSNAIIPYGVFKKSDNGREAVDSHPVSLMLAAEPDGASGYLTSFIFKKIATCSVLLRGNALFQIKMSGNGRQTLKYIPWDDVEDIKLIEGQLVYVVKGGLVLLASEVLHFKGFTFDGIVGVSVITYAAQQMNLALEVQSYSATNFQNKGVRQGVIETDKQLAATGAKAKIIEGFRRAMAEKSPDRVTVLDDGLKFKAINLTPQEAQIVEMSRFTIEDIARWFNIAPHKIKSLQQSTNNNIEQQSLDYVTDTLQPIVTNFEQELSKKLFTDREKLSGLKVKGNMNVLLRSDIKSRGEFYSKMVNSGIMKANEARRLEELNDDPAGVDLRIPVNTQTKSQIDKNNGNE